jgi:PTH2 family peptidyl-tRNA hydrolase
MAFLTKDCDFLCTPSTKGGVALEVPIDEQHQAEISHWLDHSFRKIVCYVDSLEELEAIHQKATDAGLISHMIEDNGATEFGGVKTKTCIAVGPAWEDKFIGITDHLKLA